MYKRMTHEEYQAAVFKKYGPDLIVLEPYINLGTRIAHKCTKCGDVRLRHPNVVIGGRTKRGKLLCCYQLPKTEIYRKELIAVGSTMLPIEDYKGRWKKSLHRCEICSTEANVYPKHLLRGHGCFVCAKERQTHGYFTKKNVTVDGVTRKLQGFEPQALQYMIERGANPKYIISEVREGKPTFKYRFEGTTRTFIPDFYHVTKNRIVEVKSKWTLGLTKKLDGGPFKKNAAKAKAVIDEGYDFILLLIDRKGDRIRLPEDWYNMSKAQVIRTINSENRSSET